MISKNLDIDSASCSDCNKLYRLELHCAISVKTRSSKPEIQTDTHLKTNTLTCCSRRCNIHAKKNISMHMALPGQGFLSKSTFINSLRYVVVAPKKASTLIFLRKAARSGACDFGRIVCQNPLCILPGFTVVVEDLHDEFMVRQFLVPPFLQLDLRACPRFDALHMHWERHNWVHVIGLVAGVPILVIPIRWILLNRRWDSPKAIWEPWR